MKRFLMIILCLFVLPVFLSYGAKGKETVDTIIYVAPEGKDSNSGAKDSPLATMEGAKMKIRGIKDSTGLPDSGITVYFRGGTYDVTATTKFIAEDSGTETSPIVYQAYPGEEPVFTGGQYIHGRNFNPIADETMLSRLLTDDARQNVLCYNLFENGFSYEDLDYSKKFWADGNLKEYIHEEYYDNDHIPRRMQVFIDDEALDLARYPNKVDGIFVENPYSSYLKIPTVLESGFSEETETTNGKPAKFTTWEERIKTWANYDDVIIFGMLGWEFFYNEVIAETIDPEALTIELRGQPSSGIMQGSRYAFANVFEELDVPGEYYIDKHTGMLYLYPTKDMTDATVKISALDLNFMIDAADASYLTFSGLNFELTKGSAIRIQGGRDCEILYCTFKNLGIRGVKIGEGVFPSRDLLEYYDMENGFREEILNENTTKKNGWHHKIFGSSFLNTGYSAAVIHSGNTLQRESGNMLFENNTVKHTGILGSAYQSGIILEGNGITVKNNSFSYARGQAITGNITDTEIIYNEFSDSPCDMAEDTGTIYLNYLCINDGVKIRYNYFHDVTNLDHPGIGFDFARRTAVYYDNMQPFHDFSYNIVYNMPYSYNFFSYPSPTTAFNNIIIDCNYTFEYPPEDLRELYAGMSPSEVISSYDTLGLYYQNGIYKSALWREKYPETYTYYDYMNRQKSDMNKLMTHMYNNLFINIDKPYSDRSTPLPNFIPKDYKYGKAGNNWMLEKDIGFADFSTQDFQLTKQTAAQYGVEWIDMSQIGVEPAETPERVFSGEEDPLSHIKRDTRVFVEFPTGEDFVPVSLWRQITPGRWEWVNDGALNGEKATSFMVKAGGTYTAFYHGDENQYPQFLGGVTGASPTDGVLTFFVPEKHDQWDYFTFDLIQKNK